MPLSEHVNCVGIAFKMTEQVEQQLCIKFCIRFEHSSMETIRMIQKAAAMGNWWLAASTRQCVCSCITSPGEFFGKTSNHPGDSAPLQPRFGALQLLTFPKTKIAFEGKTFQTVDENQKNTTGQLMAIGRAVWGPKVPTRKGTEASLSYVQCFLYCVCSLKKVSIFHITWLDTFWTDLIYVHLKKECHNSFPVRHCSNFFKSTSEIKMKH